MSKDKRKKEVAQMPAPAGASDPMQEVRDEIAKGKFSKVYAELDAEQKTAVDADAEQIAAAAKTRLGQAPLLLPRCGFCGSDLGTVGLKTMGMRLPGGKTTYVTKVVFCGNPECLALVAMTPLVDSKELVPPQQGSGLVGATAIPPGMIPPGGRR